MGRPEKTRGTQLLPPEDLTRMGILLSHPSHADFVSGELTQLEDDGRMPPPTIMVLPKSSGDREACLRYLGGTFFPIGGKSHEVAAIIIDGLRRALWAISEGSPLRALIISPSGMADGQAPRLLAAEAIRADLVAHHDRTGDYRVGKVFRLSRLSPEVFSEISGISQDRIRRAARLHDFAVEVGIDPDRDGLTDMGLLRARSVLSRGKKDKDYLVDYRSEVTCAVMVAIAAEGRSLKSLVGKDRKPVNTRPVSIGTMEAVALKAAQAVNAFELAHSGGSASGNPVNGDKLPPPERIADFAIQDGLWKAESAFPAWIGVTKRGGIPYDTFERIVKLPLSQQESLFATYGDAGTIKDADISRAQGKARKDRKQESAIITPTDGPGDTLANGLATASVLKVGPLTTARNLVRLMGGPNPLDFQEVEFLRLASGDILVRARP